MMYHYYRQTITERNSLSSTNYISVHLLTIQTTLAKGNLHCLGKPACGTWTIFCIQEVKVIWQKAPHGGPIPRLGVTPGGSKVVPLNSWGMVSY